MVVTHNLMLPAHFHNVEGDLSENIVGEIFGLSKILKCACYIVLFSCFDWNYYSSLLFHAGL